MPNGSSVTGIGRVSSKIARLIAAIEAPLIGFGRAVVGAAVATCKAAEERRKKKLARSLVDKAGTADNKDAELVAAELAKMPYSMLKKLKDQGTRVKVCRGSITEYRTDLRGVAPRGWPPGSTWDNVPGANCADRNEVVIATVGHGTADGAHVPKTGEGHGSANLVIHEASHGCDLNGGGTHSSADADFNTARTADAGTLGPYESQAGDAGKEETYAESAARYYGGDATDAQDHPNLNQYWSNQ